MATEKTPNYSEEAVALIRQMYEEGGNAALDNIAQAVGKTKRSVISKLVREGVYVAAVKPVKAAVDSGPTKKEMLRELESLNFSAEGLDNASKSAIQRVIDLVAAAHAAQEEA